MTLADELEDAVSQGTDFPYSFMKRAAAALRTLQAENERLARSTTCPQCEWRYRNTPPETPQ